MDFYSISKDVMDLSEIELEDARKKLTEDSNEKEFLRMFAGRDVKSRINFWLYTQEPVSSEERTIVLGALSDCGFGFSRGA